MHTVLPYLQWVPAVVAVALIAARVMSVVLRRTGHRRADAAFRRHIEPVIEVFKLADESPRSKQPR